MSRSIPNESTFEDIVQAEALIQPYRFETPILHNHMLDQLTGATLYFKPETFQRTNSFKFRGACHALLRLSDEQKKKGAYTVSSGNHGAALSAAGYLLGIPIRVAVPTNAPKSKRANIARYGAEIVDVAPGMKARTEYVKAHQDDDKVFISPYNHEHIIQGQGTAALEFYQQVEGLDAFITPVGGGGLLSGTGLVAQHYGLAAYGAEPYEHNDAWDSLRTGRIQPAKSESSICDGLLVELGEHTFNLLNKVATEILVIPEPKIIEAMRLIWDHLKIIVEPSSATVLAAILANPEVFKNKKVGVILSGANLDLDHLPWQN